MLAFQEKRPRFITYSNLVHNRDSRLLRLFFKLEHAWGDITCGHYILLVSDRRFDDCRVEGVRDQTNDKIVLCYSSVKGFVIGDIEGDWFCELDPLGELLCAVESSTGWRALVEARKSVSHKGLANRDLNASVAQNIQSRPGNETRATGMLSVWGSPLSGQSCSYSIRTR